MDKRAELLKKNMELNTRLTGLLPQTVGTESAQRDGAGKAYEVIGLDDHEVTTKIGLKKWTVDFKTLSAAQAKRLVRDGFPYLRLKNKNSLAKKAK